MEQTATLERLFERCKQGERRAQEQLYHHFASKMLGVCMRYAKSTFEAEDMLQAGFVKVFSAMQGFRGEGSLEGWIRRIIVNTAISTYRNNVRLNTEPWQETHDTAHAYELQHLECEDLLRLVRALPDGYRIVFNLYAIEGYSHKEISEKLQISEGASKSQLSRARKWLQDKLLKVEGGNV